MRVTDASDVTPHADDSRRAEAAAIAAVVRAATAQQSPQVAVAAQDVGATDEGVPPPATAVPRNAQEESLTKEAAFAVIRRAREVLKGKQVSDKTAQNYKKKVEVLHKAVKSMPAGTRHRMQEALAAYSSKSRSFYAYRAALAWYMKHQAAQLLARQDRLQKDGGHGASWLAEVAKLEGILDGLQRVQGITLKASSERTGTAPRPTESKRSDLVKIERRAPDWRDRVLQASRSSKYFLPTLLTALIGCRPEELRGGVELAWKDERVVATVVGAKQSASAGQPWRKITIAADALPSELLEAVRSQGPQRIQIDSTDAFRRHLQRVSERVLPGLPAATSYVFRHALAEDLRESGWTAEQLAAVLGQAVAETQRFYGRRRRSGQRGVKSHHHLVKNGVETARAVRPLDRSGLAALTSRQMADRRSP